MKELVIGDLVAKVPIIQGGMGVGVSLGGLAGAVAKEGGIGVISAAQPGFREDDFYTNTFEANMRALNREIKKAKRRYRWCKYYGCCYTLQRFCKVLY